MQSRALTLLLLSLSLCTTPALAQQPFRPDSSRIQLTERVVATLTDGATRFDVVAIVCHDLVPRGGSDCYDAGYLDTLSLRAFSAQAPLWTAPLSGSAYETAALSLRAGRLTVRIGARHDRWVYSSATGALLSHER